MNEILYGTLALAGIGLAVACSAIWMCCSDAFEIRTADVRVTDSKP